jgi:DNA-directed RNA polymerase specialized sigma24 family protein
MLDPVLRGFVEASDDAEAERRLAVLLEKEAAPLVRRIVARKLGAYGPSAPAAQDLEDVTADALLALVARLQSLRGGPSTPVESLADYTAAVAHNTFAHYLRRRHPARSRLKNRLRYVFTRDRRLASWPTPDGMVCGLAAWASRPVADSAGRDLERLLADREGWLPGGRRRPIADDPAEVAHAALQALGGPVDLDQLVGALAALDRSPDAEPPEEGIDLDAVPDRASVPADVALGQRRDTERLWREVCALPVRQRAALLLNLRDARGAGLLWVFPMTGVATLRQIAAALEIPAADLADLWARLPVDDHAIAERLGCTRQQVINLRSAARKRLARRLEAPDAGGGGRGNTADVPASLPDEG